MRALDDAPPLTTALESASHEPASGIEAPPELLNEDKSAGIEALSRSSSNVELQRLKEKNRNKNTDRSTQTSGRKFTQWVQEKQLHFSLETISAEELDKILQHYFAELKKKDGSDYEPDSLRTMLASLDRHFQEAGCTFKVIKDKEFQGCRQVLNGKAIELREMGKGKRLLKSDALTAEEEEVLWEKRILGSTNPSSLNFTMFYVISQHFGTRGCQEHHQIRLEHLKLVKKPNGEPHYLEWVEGLTKTRQGGLVKKDRRVPQRLFANGGVRCPLRLFEMLVSNDLRS